MSRLSRDDKPRTFDYGYQGKSDAQYYPRYEKSYLNIIEGSYWRACTGKQEGVPVPISREMVWMMGRAGKKNPNNKDFQFWQQNNEPIELNTNKLLDNTLHYTHYNPVEAGFVSKPEDWIYSSARDYAGEKGPLKVILLDYF